MDAEQLTNRIQSNSKTYAGKPTVRDTRVAVDDDKIRLLSELFDALCHSEPTARQQKWTAVAESRLAEDWRTLRQRLSLLSQKE